MVEIGDEKQEVGKDTLVESPKGTPHLLANTGKASFRFLVVKTPRQREPTKFID